MYSLGEGVKQDYHKGFLWTRKAAEQGLAEAQSLLGSMYLEGQGVRQDFNQAKEWFDKACDSGRQDGCDGYKNMNNFVCEKQ